MWNRKVFKEKAKAAFKRNYWKCVIVAVILGLLTGAGTLSTRSKAPAATGDYQIEQREDGKLYVNGEEMTKDQAVGVLKGMITDAAAQSGMSEEEFAAAALAIGAVVLSSLMVFALAVQLLKIFVWNLFTIGGCRFFVHNADEQAPVGDLLYGFSHGYGRNVAAMLLREIYIALWSLLFVIPGIVKSYSYMLVPYLLAEDADMTRAEAFRVSKALMNGNKWHAFVLDLSFIGWHILSSLTFGLVGIFYANPYIHATRAEMYRTLRDAKEQAIEF